MTLGLRLANAARAFFAPATRSTAWDSESNGGWSIARGNNPTQHIREGKSVREHGFEQHPIVGACVRIIANQIATIPLEAYTMTTSGQVELVPESPLQALLDQPAPQLSGFTFRQMLAAQLVIYGNGYAIIRRVGGRPVGLRMLHPERLLQVQVDVLTDEIVGYTWTDSSGRQKTSPWTDVVHVKDLITDPDGWFGYPRAVAALTDIATDGEASQYVRQTVTNSGVPALMLLADGGMSPADAEKFETQWQERMVKRGGRGQTRIIGNIKSATVIGHTLKELEFPLLRGVAMERICAAFNVDPRLVTGSSAKDGGDGAMSGGQFEEARRKLEQITCDPLRTAITDGLDTTLTPEFGFTYARFSPTALGKLLETPKDVADRVAVLVDKNIATLEEAREAVGLPAEMDPTHHTAAGSIRTVAKAIELSEMPPPMALPPGDSDAAPKAIADKTDKTDKTDKAAPKQIAARQSPTSCAIRGKGGLTPSQRATLWRAKDAQARTLEPAFRDRAQALFAIESATVTQLVMDSDDTRAAGAIETRKTQSFYDRIARAIASYYGPKGEAQDAWRRGFTPDIALAVNDAGSALAADIGVSFDLRNPHVTEAVRDRVNKLSGNVAETTLRQLRVIIAAGREAGQDADQIARAIRAGVLDPAITATRAQLIAETETMGAINEGEYLAAVESGVMQSIGWLDQADGDVRETHVQCGQQGWIAIGSTFSNGLRYPHDPNGAAKEVIRCRCGAIYSDLTPDDAQLDQPIGASA
jgi:HK97 family phage portal protein